jgi:hypothetical protein
MANMQNVGTDCCKSHILCVINLTIYSLVGYVTNGHSTALAHGDIVELCL